MRPKWPTIHKRSGGGVPLPSKALNTASEGDEVSHERWLQCPAQLRVREGDAKSHIYDAGGCWRDGSPATRFNEGLTDVHYPGWDGKSAGNIYLLEFFLEHQDVVLTRDMGQLKSTVLT